MNLFFRFFEIPRFWKRLITLTVDVVFICAAYFLAFYVRVGEGALDRWITGEHIVVLLITCALSLGFWINLGLYRAVIRYLDVKVLSNLAMSAIFFSNRVTCSKLSVQSRYAALGAIYLSRIYFNSYCRKPFIGKGLNKFKK